MEQIILPRLIIAGFLSMTWIAMHFSIDTPTDTDRIVFALVFCSSWLVLSLAWVGEGKA